jgi:hypothetical protein
MIDSEWKKPEEFDVWNGLGTHVMLRIDYGTGPFETVGRAFVSGTPDDPFPVFSKEGSGWCTQYVTGWRFPKMKDVL